MRDTVQLLIWKIFYFFEEGGTENSKPEYSEVHSINLFASCGILKFDLPLTYYKELGRFTLPSYMNALTSSI